MMECPFLNKPSFFRGEAEGAVLTGEMGVEAERPFCLTHS